MAEVTEEAAAEVTEEAAAEVTEEAAAEVTEEAAAEVTEEAAAEVTEEADFFSFLRGAEELRKDHCTLPTSTRGLISRLTPSISFGTLKLISRPAGALRSRMYVSVCE